MNVLLLDLSYFSIVSSLVSFSSVAEETCTSPALEFFADTTQLLARRRQRFRSSRVYHTSRIPPLTPVSSGVSKASGQILLSRISTVRPSFYLIYTLVIQKPSWSWYSLAHPLFSRASTSWRHERRLLPWKFSMFLDLFEEKKRNSRFCFSVLSCSPSLRSCPVTKKWMASHSNEVTARSWPRGRSRHRTPHRSLGCTAGDERWDVSPRSWVRSLFALERILSCKRC